MAYREDKDLEVLKFAENEHLEILVKYLTEKDGQLHINESLTSNIRFKEAAKQGNLKEAWQEIAAELQSYGGHTVTNLIRMGKGVSYRTIVLDLCKLFKIPIKDPNITIDQLEKLYVTECFSQIYFSNEEVRNDVYSKFKINDFRKLLALATEDHQVNQYIFTIIAEIYSRTDLGISIILASAIAGMTTDAYSDTIKRGDKALPTTIVLPITIAALIIKAGEPNYKITSRAVAHIAYLRMLQVKNINQEFEV